MSTEKKRLAPGENIAVKPAEAAWKVRLLPDEVLK